MRSWQNLFLANRGRNFVVLSSSAVLAIVAVLVYGNRPNGRNVFSTLVPPVVARPQYFQPEHRLPGIGADRVTMEADSATLQIRTQNVIAAQTFGIMRNGDGEKDDAGIWAERVTASELHQIIVEAGRSSTFPPALIEGIVFIESGGDGKAKSPTGPRGIMQMTAHIRNFLHLSHKEVKKQKVVVRAPRNKMLKRKTKERTIVRVLKKIVMIDDRDDPKVAIPAGAKLLADMAQYYRQRYKFSDDVSQQLAVWEWHSGRPVVDAAVLAAKKAGMKDITVPRLFFLNNPGYNPELFKVIQGDMGHDYGPTYWFRVVRAGQLLDLYRTNPNQYKKLMDENRSTVAGVKRPASRLEMWYSLDGSYQNLGQLRTAISSGALVHPPNDPDYFSYVLRTGGKDGIGAEDPANSESYATDPPVVVGTLLYIASETRRGWEQWHPTGEKFVPLEVTSMVRTAAYQKTLHKVNGNSRTEFPSHTIGAADISFAKLPPGEAMWLRFVIEDLGLDEYVGCFDEHLAQKTMHFVPSPKQSRFFRAVYDEAIASQK